MSSLKGGTRVATARRVSRRRMSGNRPAKFARHGVLVAFCACWLVLLYVVIVNAFKSQQAILSAPFGMPLGEMSVEYLAEAITSPQFNVVKAYAATLLFVVLVNLVTIGTCGPAAHLMARRTSRRYQFLLLFFVLGTFIPPHAVLIPLIYVLRAVGLMNTVAGLVLFQAAVHLPITMFLYVSYIRSIPRDIDEAAMIDGAGPIRTFWRVIFPLMRPVVATSIVLTSVSVWNDFVSPYLILGPESSLKTVTTGIYAAIGQFQQDYTVVFPDLLLVIAPVLVFFFLMQRHIVSGLTAGATK